MNKFKIFSLYVVFFFGINGLIFAEIEYPQRLKKEMRCYPHANISQTLDVTDMAMAKLNVTDRFSKILNFYNKELNKMGWKISTITKKENTFTILADKGKKNIVIDADLHNSGESTITITMDSK